LFSKLCEFECNHAIAAHKPIPDALRPRDFPNLPIPKAASVEQMYFLLHPYYMEMKNNIDASPTFQGCKNQAALCEIYRLTNHISHSDHQHWNGEQLYDTNGSPLNKMHLNKFDYHLLSKEMERILVVARESLTPEEAMQLPNHLHEQVDGYLIKRDLKYTDPALAQKAEKEINRVLNQFVLYEPFYAHFLLRCVRQVSDTIQTAGVALLKKYILLIVNPSFFMNDLKNTSERGAVLLHEALHIMNKHIIQMHKDTYSDKRLYNIAADLEINQLIGGKWKLPEGALSIHKPPFATLKLPEFDLAETYYTLLLKEKDQNSSAWQKIKPMTENDTIGGHSDHHGWGKESKEKGSLKPMGGAKGGDIDAHEMDIERAVREAAQSTQAGKLPNHISTLLDQWKKERAPAIDWKRELRIFTSFNPSTTMRRTHNKKSNRFRMNLRRSLAKNRITTDVLFAFSRYKPDQLPTVIWGDLAPALQNKLIGIEPRLNTIDDHHTIVLHKCLHLTVYTLLCEHPIQWPTWDDVPDKLLSMLHMVRVPIDPDVLPFELFVTLAKQRPKLLPKLSWEEHFGAFEKKSIKKLYPNILKPTWGLLPADEIIKVIINNPEQFQIKLSDVPQDFLSQFVQYDFRGTQPFRVERIVKRLFPGLKPRPELPKLLIMIDESGSVGNDDLSYFFTEIDGIHGIGCEVYILKFDTTPALFHRYNRTHPKQRDASGGTAFDPPLQWLNDARHGVEIMMKDSDGEKSLDTVTIKFDGAIILTDGYAAEPTVKPYCRLMWVLTPSGSDDAIRQANQPYGILKLPPYEKR
ncbi:MAG: hypothetical protein CL916_06900, partial [Deltaproteobacteria bacterium]|nr:hypothetical protein [Deltaproteobacteria bacterium]